LAPPHARGVAAPACCGATTRDHRPPPPLPRGKRMTTQFLRPPLDGTARHAFTVDLEDWYHGIPIAAESKRAAEKRLHVGTEKLLDLLQRSNARATFFVLTPTVREHTALCRRIVDAGHDVG